MRLNVRVSKLTVLLMAGAVVACGGSDESSPPPESLDFEVTTSRPARTTTSEAPTTAAPTSTPPGGSDGEFYDEALIDGLGEEAFLTYVRENLFEFDVAPDADLVGLVQVTCSTIRDGTSPDDALGTVAASAERSGVSDTQAAAFVVLHVAGIHAFCPEYSEGLPLPVP